MNSIIEKLGGGKRLPVETPISLRASFLSTASGSSSNSVSSTNSSIFDRPLTGQETPPTPPERNDGRGRSLSKGHDKEEEQQHDKTLEEMLNDLKIQYVEGNYELKRGSRDSPMAQKHSRIGWKMRQEELGDPPHSVMRDEDEDEYLPSPRSKKTPSSQRGDKVTSSAVHQVDLADVPSDGEEMETRLALNLSKGNLEFDLDFHGPKTQASPMTKPQEEKRHGKSRSRVNAVNTPSSSRRYTSSSSSPPSAALSQELPFYESGPESPAYVSQRGSFFGQDTSKPSPEGPSSSKPNRNAKASNPTPEPEVLMDPFKPYHDSNRPYSSLEVKNEVLHVLEQKWKTPRSKEKKIASPINPKGYVYIFTWPDFPNYVKIGITKNRPTERVGQWGAKCKFTYKLVEDPKNMSFKISWIVERLIQAELHNERRKFKCSKCRKVHKLDGSKSPMGKKSAKTAAENDGLVEHGEWYEISEERALEVVQRWRRWVVNNKPYKDDGTLREAWMWKHDVTNRSKASNIDWARWCQWTWVDESYYWLYLVDEYLERWFPRTWHPPPGWIASAFLMWVYFCFGAGKQGFAAVLIVLVLLAILWRKYCN